MNRHLYSHSRQYIFTLFRCQSNKGFSNKTRYYNRKLLNSLQYFNQLHPKDRGPRRPLLLRYPLEKGRQSHYSFSPQSSFRLASPDPWTLWSSGSPVKHLTIHIRQHTLSTTSVVRKSYSRHDGLFHGYTQKGLRGQSRSRPEKQDPPRERCDPDKTRDQLNRPDTERSPNIRYL